MAILVGAQGPDISCQMKNGLDVRQSFCADGIAGGYGVRIRIDGIVQGVGFRPFIYQLAKRHGIGGWVRNQSDGVEIAAAGSRSQVEQFLEDIRTQSPPLARIVQMKVSDQPGLSYNDFQIIKSSSTDSRSTLIAPDVCTCNDCLQELFDPQDRRFRYPFINCTNCGPRYTIIKDIPYDRAKTTMAAFPMCPLCRSEYENPLDRRFHAQPNACWDCGPQIWLESADTKRLAEGDEALKEAVKLLERGAIVAIKGLGGFHLAVDAESEGAVGRLRRRKIREEKPFAVMFRDVETIRRYCRVSDAEADLVKSLARPIVLLKKLTDPNSSKVALSVAPRNRFLGAFLPYTPLHHLLFADGNYTALVMTSGNQSDEPIVMENETAKKRLSGIADFFLLHNRDIYMRCDDSVVRFVNNLNRPVRRARGYVPVPVFLREEFPQVLAVGAELKNTVCLTRKREAFLSQHIGDLENLETLRSFEHAIAHLQQILEIQPECIVYDMHPDYLSTRWALEQKNFPKLAVQHHHAHIASVVAERKISEPVLGLALDGTGYGMDGTIWGGEILRVDGERFERLGHLRHVPMPGGDRAIKEPWRMAVAYLWCSKPSDLAWEFREILQRWPEKNVRIILQMVEKGVNSPLTSSCGRLFDAVSALIGLRDTITYEGQAAIELEQAIEPDGGSYSGRIEKEQDVWILDPLPMISEILEDVRRREAPGIISARFHNGLIDLLMAAVRAVSEEVGLRRVVLSGGVFQNAYLSGRLETALREGGFEVFQHIEVPPNDACISLGQAYIGGLWLRSQGEDG